MWNGVSALRRMCVFVCWCWQGRSRLTRPSVPLGDSGICPLACCGSLSHLEIWRWVPLTALELSNCLIYSSARPLLSWYSCHYPLVHLLLSPVSSICSGVKEQILWDLLLGRGWPEWVKASWGLYSHAVWVTRPLTWWDGKMTSALGTSVGSISRFDEIHLSGQRLVFIWGLVGVRVES